MLERKLVGGITWKGMMGKMDYDMVLVICSILHIYINIELSHNGSLVTYQKYNNLIYLTSFYGTIFDLSRMLITEVTQKVGLRLVTNANPILRSELTTECNKSYFCIFG